MIYDYENNINIVTTYNGDKVITMNPEIFVEITNMLYATYEKEKTSGYKYTADNVHRIWKKFSDSK